MNESFEVRRRRTMAVMACLLAAGRASWAADRFTPIIEGAGASTVNASGFVVNAKRQAVHRELAQRPPTAAEVGVRRPERSVLVLEDTARRQYHPRWRICVYRVNVSRGAFVQHFEAQGLRRGGGRLLSDGFDGDFIDGFERDPVTGQVTRFRIRRRPKP